MYGLVLDCFFFFFFKAREEVVSESPPHARGKRGTESTAGT